MLCTMLQLLQDGARGQPFPACIMCVRGCLRHMAFRYNSHMLTYGSCRAPAFQERGSSLSSLRNAGLDMTLEGLEPRTQLGNRRLTGTIQQKQYPGASCPAVQTFSRLSACKFRPQLTLKL